MKEIKRLDGGLYRRACESIAHAALTNSKRPESFVKGVYPTHLKRGLGCKVWDTYGNEYIDFICGLGTNLLGYGNDDISTAVINQCRNGNALSLGTELEVKCAERVKEFVPFVDRVRFLKTGSEATTAACIIARAYTGHRYILSDGYHAWHPEFTSLTPPANGITEHESIGKFSSIEQLVPMTAAVIVEPIITDYSPERIEFLRYLRKRCTELGIVLIFDEVITGLRWPGYTVAQHYDIIPDILCLGKALGGGFSLSAVCGEKEIMEGDYFVSSTFAGETVPLAACMKSLDLLQHKFKISYLWEKGLEFQFKFNEIWREGMTLVGYPTRGVFKAKDDLTQALFMQECCRSNILVGPSFFFNFHHVDVMDEVLSTFKDILTRIKQGAVELIGEMPVKPYAQKVRQS